MDDAGRYSHATTVFHNLTGMNAKRNPAIGNLAEKIHVAIAQERLINQDIHNIKGLASSNIGKIIEGIINEKPEKALNSLDSSFAIDPEFKKQYDKALADKAAADEKARKAE